MPAKILVLNGSLGGANGNTGHALRDLLGHFSTEDIETLHLVDHTKISSAPIAKAGLSRELIAQKLSSAEGFIFATGTYWDSWGSPLQIFLEQTTEFEGSDLWLGKPALCLVTMHSVGGKEVLSRLQGVLSTLGLLIPPMSGMAYSMTGRVMLESARRDPSFDDDIWSLHDFKKMAQNFRTVLTAIRDQGLKFESWPTDVRDPSRLWLK